MKNQQIIIPLLITIIVGAVAFFGGMQYQKMQRTQAGQFGNVQFGRGGFLRGSGNPGQRGSGAVIGQIISADDKSITVKLMDGSSKIVLLSDTTTISKATTGAKTDLVSGSNVAVFGTTNSDGSVTAQNVQLNPMMFRRGGQPSSSPIPNGSPM